jgi:hypothetical protein
VAGRGCGPVQNFKLTHYPLWHFRARLSG